MLSCLSVCERQTRMLCTFLCVWRGKQLTVISPASCRAPGVTTSGWGGQEEGAFWGTETAPGAGARGSKTWKREGKKSVWIGVPRLNCVLSGIACDPQIVRKDHVINSNDVCACGASGEVQPRRSRRRMTSALPESWGTEKRDFKLWRSSWSRELGLTAFTAVKILFEKTISTYSCKHDGTSVLCPVF